MTISWTNGNDLAPIAGVDQEGIMFEIDSATERARSRRASFLDRAQRRYRWAPKVRRRPAGSEG